MWHLSSTRRSIAEYVKCKPEEREEWIDPIRLHLGCHNEKGGCKVDQGWMSPARRCACSVKQRLRRSIFRA